MLSGAKFQDNILNGKISFVEGENGTHMRECPIKLLLATLPHLNHSLQNGKKTKVKPSLLARIDIDRGSQSALSLEQVQTGWGLVPKTHSANYFFRDLTCAK